MKPWMYNYQIVALTVLVCVSMCVLFSSTGWYSVVGSVVAFFIAPSVGFTYSHLLEFRKELIEKNKKKNEKSTKSESNDAHGQN